MERIEGLQEFVRSKEYREALGLPAEQVENYEMFAHGEYNMNYVFTHPVTGKRLLLRVECGSQMHLDNQIEYEALGLRLIENSGHTPHMYYYDNSKKYLDHGVLIEEFLPGGGLDIENDEHLAATARALAEVHAVNVGSDTHLIDPGNSLAAIIEESEQMVKIYMDSDLGDDETKRRIRRLLDRGWEMIEGISDGDIYRCCINTDVNSTNFLADEQDENGCKVYVIDWEKPLYGDPAQDLGHFLTPTTSFWKTDVIWDRAKMDWFIDEYIKAVDGRFDTEGLRERTHRFITITCLRGITWCAMAWVQYQMESKALFIQSTWDKLSCYLSDPLLASVEELFWGE